MPELKAVFKKALKCVNFWQKAKHQLGLVCKYQIRQFGRKKVLIASTILQWGTQFNLLHSLLDSKSALQVYAWDDDVVFKRPKANKSPNYTIDYLIDPSFWPELNELLAILGPIYNAQKMLESNKSTLDKVYDRWLAVQLHLTH